MKTKTCKQCGKKKPVSKFYKNKKWYTGKCKKCIGRIRKEYYQENKEKIKKRKHKYWVKNKRSDRQKEKLKLQRSGLKRCTECEQIKPFVEFPFIKIKDIYGSKCKKCCNKRARKWYADNKEHQRELARKWRKNNPDKVKAIQRKHRKSKKYRDYRKQPKVRISLRMGNGIRKSIARKSKKGNHWEDFVDYNINELRQHLEKQFTDKMTWDNYGKYWHIEHILPISSFHYTKPEHIGFKKCWSLNNLRPLEAKENLKKGDKLIKPKQEYLTI